MMHKSLRHPAGILYYISALTAFCPGARSQTIPTNGQIAVTDSCAIALRSDGVIYAWGNNDYGQLGYGNKVSQKTPVPLKYKDSAGDLVTLGSNCQIVNASSYYPGINASLRTDGGVWVWGTQGGNWPTYAKKLEVAGSAKYIAANDDTLVMIRPNGTLFRRWAELDEYTNPDAPTVAFSLAADIPAVENGANVAFTQVKISSDNHIIALDSNKRVWTSGPNGQGTVGNGTTTAQSALQKVAALASVNVAKIWIASSYGGGPSRATCYAISEAGVLYAWGANAKAQIGDGTTTDRLIPVIVPDTGLVADLYAGPGQQAIICTDGSIKAWSLSPNGWGYNEQKKPVAVPELSQAIQKNGAATAVQIGFNSIVNSLGELWMFGEGFCYEIQPTEANGYNYYIYDLGRGDGAVNAYKTAPVALADTKQVRSISAGLLQRSNGRLMAWGIGRKYMGSTAEAINYYKSIPNAPVAFYDNPLIRDATKTATCGTHALILSRGMVLAFGQNTSGQLGNGTTAPSAGVVVSDLGDDVVDIAAWYGQSWALKADGTVWFWGGGTLKPKKLILSYLVDDIEPYMALEWGNGKVHMISPTSATNNEQYEVPVLANIKKIAGSSYANFALTASGTVYSWGYGPFGELGLGSVEERPDPTTVISGLTGVVDIKASGFTVIALLSSGAVRTWGNNPYGQVGDGTLVDRRTPYAVPGLTGVTAVAIDDDNCYALKSDGTVVGWGLGGSRLGYNPALASLMPVRLKTDTADSDRDGIPNAWETANGITSATVDEDTDGLVNIQEYVKGTDPEVADTDGDVVNDFADSLSGPPYQAGRKDLSDTHANSYDLFVLGGDNQLALAGSVNREAFDVALWNIATFTPHTGISVSFTVVSPSGAVDLAQTGLFSAKSVSKVTDQDGTAQAYFKQPSQSGVVSRVQFRAGVEEYTFVTASVAPVPFVPSGNLTMPLDQTGFTDLDNDTLNDNAENAGWSARKSDPVQITTDPASVGYQLFTP